jgi:uncharacterized protein (TIGR03435 family)
VLKTAFFCYLIAQGATPAFDVASVKLYQDSGVGSRRAHSTYTPTGVDFGARTLGFLLAEAYGMPVARVVPGSDKKVLDRLRDAGYDVVAKTDHNASRDQLRAMLQTLLTERFHLVLRRETRTSAVLRLVQAKGGAKLEEGDGGDLVMAGSPDGYTFRNAEIHRLAGYLSSNVGRMVVDETGLKGLYNITVKKPADLQLNPVAKDAMGGPEAPPPSVFAEMLKPLGLELKSGTGAVEFLVVDRAEALSEN